MSESSNRTEDIGSMISDIENNDEEFETIPCEICNNQIAIHNYTIHSQRCLERREIANRIRMNSINRRRAHEIIQSPNQSFRPISFNFESNLDYRPFQYSLNNS